MIQKILSRKSAFKAKLFTVDELAVEVKPDVVHIHHHAKRNPIVMVLPLSDTQEVHLVSQYRYNLGKDVIECVAGYIEDGESPLVAAKRELAEETGLRAKKWKKLPDIELGGGVFTTKIYIYIAQELEKGRTSFDMGEDIDTITLPIHEAVRKVIAGEIHIMGSMLTLLFAEKLLSERKL